MENKFDLIEKYLMNEMSVREQIEFERLLKNDSDLMREYLLRKDINEAVLEDDVMSLRDNLDKIINDKPIKSRFIKNSYIYSAVAAVIIIVIVVYSIYLIPHLGRDEKDVFQTYYSPYTAIMSFRSATDQTEIEKILYDAFNFYDERKYEAASDYFKIVLEKDNTNYMSQFYLSICEIEKNNFKRAEKYLNDLILKNDNILWEQSHWYLALVYIKQNENANAERVLKKIVKENMTQKSEAEIILKILY